MVVTGSPTRQLTIRVRAVLTLFEKTIKGSLFGSNPQRDILRCSTSTGGRWLDRLVTSRYSLEQVSQGYADLVGKTSAAWSSTSRIGA